MEKWKGKICVVTGASVGIGASVALALADEGMIVIGLARRVAEIEVTKYLKKNLINLKKYSRNYQRKLVVVVKFLLKNVTSQKKMKCWKLLITLKNLEVLMF